MSEHRDDEPPAPSPTGTGLEGTLVEQLRDDAYEWEDLLADHKPVIDADVGTNVGAVLQTTALLREAADVIDELCLHMSGLNTKQLREAAERIEALERLVARIATAIRSEPTHE